MSNVVPVTALQEEALAAQSLDTLEALAAMSEAALPRVRHAIVAARVAAARSEAVEAAACAVCLAAARDTFLNCGEPGGNHKAAKELNRKAVGQGAGGSVACYVTEGEGMWCHGGWETFFRSGERTTGVRGRRVVALLGSSTRGFKTSVP